jgi:hypothetical protein
VVEQVMGRPTLGLVGGGAVAEHVAGRAVDEGDAALLNHVQAEQAVGGGIEDAAARAPRCASSCGGALLHKFLEVLAVARELGLRLLALR